MSDPTDALIHQFGVTPEISSCVQLSRQHTGKKKQNRRQRLKIGAAL